MLYLPGLMPEKVYSPAPSVIVAPLLTESGSWSSSTATPGRGAESASLTFPLMVAATAGRATPAASAAAMMPVSPLCLFRGLIDNGFICCKCRLYISGLSLRVTQIRLVVLRNV